MSKINLKGLENAWIEPKGTIHEVGYMCHNEYAYEILPKLLKCKDWEVNDKFEKKTGVSTFSISGGSMLHELGWIRLLTWTPTKTGLYGDCCDMTKKVYDTIDPAMSKEQKIFAREWCKANDFKFRDLFKD